MSVKARLVLSIAVVLAVALGGLVAVIATLTTNQAQADGLRYASSLASRHAEELGAGITRQRAAAQNLADMLGVLAGGRSGNRTFADRVEREMLVADPSLLGVWSAFEPDAFDGQDAGHVGSPTTDATGRYISYWFRDGGTVSVAPLVDYTVPGAGDYYLLPRDSGREVAIEPYLYVSAARRSC
jgi:methyl-accepting chemotaxis protein